MFCVTRSQGWEVLTILLSFRSLMVTKCYTFVLISMDLIFLCFDWAMYKLKESICRVLRKNFKWIWTICHCTILVNGGKAARCWCVSRLCKKDLQFDYFGSAALSVLWRSSILPSVRLGKSSTSTVMLVDQNYYRLQCSKVFLVTSTSYPKKNW